MIAVRMMNVDGDRILRRESVAVDPLCVIRDGLVQRVGNDDRVPCGIRQKHEAPIGFRGLRIVGRALEVFAPHDHACQRLAGTGIEFDERSASLGGRRSIEFQSSAVRRADRLALTDLEPNGLHDEVAHFRDVGREIAALADYPAHAVAAQSERRVRRLDTNHSDVRAVQPDQDRFAEHGILRRLVRPLLVLQPQRRGAQHDQDRDEDSEESGTHARTPLTMATRSAGPGRGARARRQGRQAQPRVA